MGFNVGIGNIGSAMSIFGFVFFIQPIMMAMMQEMPVRRTRMLMRCVRIVMERPGSTTSTQHMSCHERQTVWQRRPHGTSANYKKK